jgi:hypothetical protein
MQMDDKGGTALEGPPPAVVVLDTVFSYVTAALLNAMVRLGVPDAMGEGAMEVPALAAACGAHAGSLKRALRVMEMKGFVRRDGEGRYSLTEAGLLLRSDVPGSLNKMVRWACDPFHFEAHSAVYEGLVDGSIPFDGKYGEPFFEWLPRPENADEAHVFNEAMTAMSQMAGPAVLEAYDFSRFRSVTDIGGGHGSLLCGILEANPELQGVVAEMEPVAAEASKAIAASSVKDRCTARASNFFESVPAGSDCYMMKHIIHDWDDEPALKILRNVRAVLPQDGTLLVIDAVLDDGAQQNFAKQLDIEMMVLVGGKERTESEFRELLRDAGFALKRVVATKSPVSIVEAAPA